MPQPIVKRWDFSALNEPEFTKLVEELLLTGLISTEMLLFGSLFIVSSLNETEFLGEVFAKVE